MEHGSLRAYVSALYANPRMRIFIQGQVVHTRILKHSLYKPITYIYSSNKFKHRAVAAREDALKELNNG